MSENMLSLISKVAELELELECAKTRMKYVREFEKCAIWEYDIATKTLTLERKLDGRYADENKTVKNYQASMHSWNIIHPDDWDIFDAYCDSMNNGDEFFSYDYRQVVNNAMFVWVRNTGSAVYNEDGIPYKVVGKTLDISSEMKQKEDLIRMAEYDSLTGLLNKQSFISNVKKYISDSTNSTFGGSFYIVDIDDFKRINDTKGHKFGDEIIKKVGTILKESLPSNNFVGRIGGDEYCIFIKGKSTENDSQKFANTLIEKATKIELFDGIHLSISIGISLYPAHGLEFDRLFDCADWALYYSKTMGKNQAKIYFQEERDITEIDSESLSGFFGLISDIDSFDDSEEKINLESTSDKDRYSISQQVFNNLKASYYVVDSDTFEILDYSKNLQRVLPFMKEKGRLCYEKIAGRQTPCSNCPVVQMVNSKTNKFKTLEYKSRFGKLLRMNCKDLDDSKALVAIQDISKFAEVNSRFNMNVGALTLQSFISRINNSVLENKKFMICALSLSENENTENKIEMIKSLFRHINHLINEDEPLCLIHNDVIMCQLFREREAASIFASSVLMSYNAYFRNETSDNSSNAYGALYIPDTNENAGQILNKTFECLKEAYIRRSFDDHYYLISDRM